MGVRAQGGDGGKGSLREEMGVRAQGGDGGKGSGRRWGVRAHSGRRWG